MKKLFVLFALLFSMTANAAITAEQKYLLNSKMGAVASKVQLGTLLDNAVKFAGTFTTAGGDASESITVTGAAASDIVVVTVKTAGGTPRSIVAATAAANAINVTLSGDPSTDHVLQYLVYRP